MENITERSLNVDNLDDWDSEDDDEYVDDEIGECAVEGGVMCSLNIGFGDDDWSKCSLK